LRLGFVGMLGLRGGAGLKAVATMGSRGEAVVVVAVDGVADGFPPAAGVEGVDVFVLGDVDGLQEGLGQVGNGAGDLGFYIAADYGGASGEVVAGEVVGQVLAETLSGAGSGFFLGVVEAEVGIIADAGSAATAAIRERKRTQGHAVLCTERGHGNLLRVEFWDLNGKEHGQECLCDNRGLKQKRPGWSRGAVCNRDIVPQRQDGSS